MRAQKETECMEENRMLGRKLKEPGVKRGDQEKTRRIRRILSAS